MAECGIVVLVVDDEPGIRDMLRWVLGGPGFEIRTARDGSEAVEHLGSARVDLVITDLTMPRVDGFMVITAAASKRIPVIAVSGFGTVEMAVHVMKLGATDFLLKPFDVESLRASIQECLRGVTKAPLIISGRRDTVDRPASRPVARAGERRQS